ncbi:hypothetical protein [Rhodoblastus sp.]|uniref:hypothetical protein n=1 Tax=Rhodoblastus sp. TaxID=1962975 RepID=UPI0035AE4550
MPDVAIAFSNEVDAGSHKEPWVREANTRQKQKALPVLSVGVLDSFRFLFRLQPGGANVAGLSIGRIDAYHRDIENLINRRCNGVSTGA